MQMVCSESGLWGEPRVVQPEQAAAWQTAQALTSQGNKAGAQDGDQFPTFNFRIAFGDQVFYLATEFFIVMGSLSCMTLRRTWKLWMGGINCPT